MLPPNIYNKLAHIRKQTPLYEVDVSYYDCNVDDPIIGAPKNPGVMGNTNNPGLPIRWESKGVSNPEIPNATLLTETDKCPQGIIGKYIFEDVVPNDYVLEIARKGFLPRYGVISIKGGGYLGHRELLGGDVNGDLVINEKDLSAIQAKMSTYGSSVYNWIYDLDGNQSINSMDADIIRMNLGVNISIYQETEEWLNQ